MTNHCGTPFVQRVSCHSSNRVFAHYDRAHNARLDCELYEQCWMAETAFSALKRRFGSAVGPSVWYRQFCELVLPTAIYNLEQAIKE